jgi:hypothetical protein
MLRGRPRAPGARVITLCLMITAFLAAIPLTGSARAASPAGTLGVYKGAASPGGVGAFGSWIGRRPGFALDFLGKSNWSDIEQPLWLVDGWRGSGYDVIYSVPLLPDSDGTLAQGAAGDYNAHFRRLAEALAARGQGGAVLRLGWEMNGDWYRWSIKNGAAEFGAYWRQIVTTMRSVSPSLRFDYTVNMGSSLVDGRRLDPEASYPGDAFVDYIGMDAYDQGWGPNNDDPRARWQTNMDMPYGLAWHRDFARNHGKPMSFPEWALTTRDDGAGGGDAPYFIERMHDWITSNRVAYHMYFDFDAPDGSHELMNGQFPRAAARFKQLFRDDASNEQATPPPAPVLHAYLVKKRKHRDGRARVRLRWSKRTTRLDLYRDGRRIARSLNSRRRALTDKVRRRAHGRRHSYRLCPAGRTTGCSKRVLIRSRKR